MPRIIAGTAGGIYLDTPKGMKTRPTSDRAKEALFSILGGVYQDKNVLDLYSGTGSLGIETLSRGAVSCIFVDKGRKATGLIKRNLDKCRLRVNASVICMDVSKSLSLSEIKSNKYACIFMDPPYNKKLLIGTIEKISENDIMEKNGILVVEHSGGEVPPAEIAEFSCVDRRNYGTVNFSFYKLVDALTESGEIK